jgi:hypothetical protein
MIVVRCIIMLAATAFTVPLGRFAPDGSGARCILFGRARLLVLAVLAERPFKPSDKLLVYGRTSRSRGRGQLLMQRERQTRPEIMNGR